MKRWKLIALAVVIFGAGMVVGGGIGFRMAHNLIFRALTSPPEKIAEHMTARITKELDLDEQQQQEVSKIALERAQAFRGILDDTRPKIEEQFELFHTQVSEVLNPEQKKEWDARHERMKKRFEERFSSK